MTVAVTGALDRPVAEAAMVMALPSCHSREAIEARGGDRARNAIKSLLALAPSKPRCVKVTAVGRASASKLSLSTQQCASVQESAFHSMVSSRRTECHRPVPCDWGKPAYRQRLLATKSFAGTINQSAAFGIPCHRARFGQHPGAHHPTCSRASTVVPCANAALCRSVCPRSTPPAVFILAVAVVVVSAVDHGLDLDAGCLQGLGVVGHRLPLCLGYFHLSRSSAVWQPGGQGGDLIKGGVYLEDARKIKAVALDKTGTITEGESPNWWPSSPWTGS